MSDRQQPRDLTPRTPRRWKVIGLEQAHRCTFCGRRLSATVGCPDDDAPILFQVGLMRRFSEVKHQRVVELAFESQTCGD
jgi:hypothetical protein